jgi:hypothetical protein
MPPLNPSGKKAKIPVAIFSKIAITRPELSSRAARCIALGAQIESLYGAVLTTVLGAYAAPAAAMYRSLQSLNAQLAVVHAAAEVVLNQEEMGVLNAITRISNRALKHRHRFAHWVWGHHQGYPDALTLIKPEALLEYETSAQGFMHPNEGRGLLDGFDVGRCLVYDAKALDEAIKELQEAESLLSQFRLVVIPYNRANRANLPDWLGLQQLKLQPAIAEELRALEKQRSGTPAKPSRWRGRGRSAKP